MRLVLARVGDRHLVRAPEVLDLLAVNFPRAGPPFRAAQHDHRPAWPFSVPLRGARCSPDRTDAVENSVERRGHRKVHRHRLATLDEERLIAVADEETAQFFV